MTFIFVIFTYFIHLTCLILKKVFPLLEVLQTDRGTFLKLSPVHVILWLDSSELFCRVQTHSPFTQSPHTYPLRYSPCLCFAGVPCTLNSPDCTADFTDKPCMFSLPSPVCHMDLIHSLLGTASLLLPTIFPCEALGLWSSFQIPLVPQCCPLAPTPTEILIPVNSLILFMQFFSRPPFCMCVLVSVWILQGKSCVIMSVSGWHLPKHLAVTESLSV